MAVVVNFGFNLGVTFACVPCPWRFLVTPPLLSCYSLPLAAPPARLDPMEQWIDTLSPGRGPSYLFMIYAMFSVLSMLFVYKCVPETKGKSLEQIEAMLR